MASSFVISTSLRGENFKMIFLEKKIYRLKLKKQGFTPAFLVSDNLFNSLNLSDLYSTRCQ